MTTKTDGIDNLYDHEVKAILQVQAALSERAQSRHLNYGAFEREVRSRFAEIGFEVAINWYTYAIDDVPQEGALPEITVVRRAEKIAWDPDRQVHEAVHDVLELGEEGWISTDKDTLRRFQEQNSGHGEGHSHGHGHSH